MKNKKRKGGVEWMVFEGKVREWERNERKWEEGVSEWKWVSNGGGQRFKTKVCSG